MSEPCPGVASEPHYEYRVVCPDGVWRVGSACKPDTDREWAISWALRNANSTLGGLSSHGSRCPGEHILQRREVSEWEPDPERVAPGGTQEAKK